MSVEHSTGDDSRIESKFPRDVSQYEVCGGRKFHDKKKHRNFDGDMLKDAIRNGERDESVNRDDDRIGLRVSIEGRRGVPFEWLIVVEHNSVGKNVIVTAYVPGWNSRDDRYRKHY